MTQERRERGLLKRFYINRSYQLKHTMMAVLASTLMTLVFGYMYYRNESAKTEMLQIQNPDLASMLSASDHTVLYSLLAFFLLQFVTIFFLGLFFTHRVAGPIYRLQKYFETVEYSGVVSPFEGVRENDEFKELFEVLARTITKVRQRNQDVSDKLKRIAHLIQQNQVEQAKQEITALVSRLS